MEVRKLFYLIVLGLIIISFIYLGLKDNGAKEAVVISDQNEELIKCGAFENSFVTKVIDGDTIVVEGGYHVRLLGIDSDEKGYPCYDPAKKVLEELILGKMVRLEKDRTEVDKYGRCLRYAFKEGENVNLKMVKEGFAVARFYYPDVKYKEEIALAEKFAKEKKQGCKWGQ
jgi:endonuclease YncB( thermonuclease family)